MDYKDWIKKVKAEREEEILQEFEDMTMEELEAELHKRLERLNHEHK